MVFGVWPCTTGEGLTVIAAFNCDCTPIVPVALAPGQPPVGVTVYMNVPVFVGVPLMVTTLADQLPVTPPGNPEIVAPVAPVVA